MIKTHRHTIATKGQGDAHDLTSMVAGPSLNVPFDEGDLLLGQWQQIALFEFDTRARQREIVVQIIGE